MTDREMNDLEGFFEPVEVPGHRLYPNLRGSHIIVSVYSGPRTAGPLAKNLLHGALNGMLVFTPEEWASFRQNFTWSQDELHLREVQK